MAKRLNVLTCVLKVDRIEMEMVVGQVYYHGMHTVQYSLAKDTVVGDVSLTLWWICVVLTCVVQSGLSLSEFSSL